MRERVYQRIMFDQLADYETRGWRAVGVERISGGMRLVCLVMREVAQ